MLEFILGVQTTILLAIAVRYAYCFNKRKNDAIKQLKEYDEIKFGIFNSVSKSLMAEFEVRIPKNEISSSNNLSNWAQMIHMLARESLLQQTMPQPKIEEEQIN